MGKYLVAIGIASLLAAGSAPAAFADRGYHGNRWDQFDNRQRWNNRHYRQHQRYRNSFGQRYWRGGRYFAPPRYRYNGYWGVPTAFIGGAIVGSSLNYSRYHDRNDHRYCDHGVNSSGCYRVERLPDGRERRIELPRSACY